MLLLLLHKVPQYFPTTSDLPMNWLILFSRVLKLLLVSILKLSSQFSIFLSNFCSSFKCTSIFWFSCLYSQSILKIQTHTLTRIFCSISCTC